MEQPLNSYFVSDDVRRLATHVSIASRIEPELLRAVRLRLLPDLDVSAEADFWFSDLVEARSTLRIVLRPDVAAVLRGALASDAAALDAVRDVIAAVHVHAPPAIRLEEELTYAGLRGGDGSADTINGLLMAALQAIAAGRRGLVDWAARALPRMPLAVLRTPAAVALDLVSGSHAADETMQFRRAVLDDPVVAALVASALPEMTIHARLIAIENEANAIELSRAGLESAHAIKLPHTEPLLVDLSTANQSEVVEIPEEGSVIRRIAGGVSIRTITGSVFELEPMSADVRVPEVGEVVSGTIVSISGQSAFIAYGGTSEAIMDAAELEGLDVGDLVEGQVRSNSPNVRISRTLRATIEQLRQVYENRLPVEGLVRTSFSGGFEISLSGFRAFCPLSEIALGKITNPDSFVGQILEFRITAISDDGRRIVVSRAALLKEEAAERAAELRERIVPGAEIMGRVKTVTPFGAFIDLGGIDGLLHVSEMSRRRITDPKEIVQAGQELRVKVIKIENDGKRISLSIKDWEPDPWNDIVDRYTPGTQFTGRIVRATDFGYFVEVEPGLDGIVHVSQLPLGVKVGDPEVIIGTTVQGWVRDVDPSKKRLSLSLRAVAVTDPWETAEQRYPIGQVVQGTVDHAAAPGVFVELEPGLSGLIPNSEIDAPAGTNPSQVHHPGEKLLVRVMSVDRSRKRISLSHEAAKAFAEREEYVKFMKERSNKGDESGESAMTRAFKRAMERNRTDNKK
jgi:small subunit ribosomal protein S1